MSYSSCACAILAVFHTIETWQEDLSELYIIHGMGSRGLIMKFNNF